MTADSVTYDDLDDVALATLDAGQLLKLRNMMMAISRPISADDVLYQAYLQLPAGGDGILQAASDVIADRKLRGWLWSRCQEVDDVYQAQVDALKAAELDLAGGHRSWVDNGSYLPEPEPWEPGWDAFCDCGWTAHELPSKAAAEQACREHEAR